MTRPLRHSLLLLTLTTAACTMLSERPDRTCDGICGQVLDAESGEPVRAFEVAVFSLDPQPFPAPRFQLPPGFPTPPGPLLLTESVTAEDGFFDISDDGARAVALGVSAADYDHAQTQLSAPARTPLVIRLRKSPRIRGVVVTSGGDAVAGARVYYDSAGTPLDEALRRAESSTPRATTDEDGRFDLARSIGPPARVLITHDGFVPVRSDLSHRDITMVAATTVAGFVKEPDGRPAAGAAVELRCNDFGPLHTFTNTVGIFRFRNVPSAGCVARAAYELVNGERSVELGPMPAAEVEVRGAFTRLQLPRSQRISGRIIGLERTAPGYFAVAEDDSARVELPTGTDGSFSHRLPPGRWRISGGFQDATTLVLTDTVTVVLDGNAAGPVRLTFPASSIEVAD